MRVLLIDNYDSYTYNLHHLITDACDGEVPLTVANDAFGSWEELVRALPPFGAVVISPGPGSAERRADFGVCGGALTSGLPVLGVCLGHQGLALAFGGRVRRGAEPMHGRVSEVRVVEAEASLFAGLPSCFEAVRYHSLVVDEPSLPPCLRVTARSSDGAVMAIEHRSLPLHGLQFHPESVCTQHGRAMLANFVRLAAAWAPSDSSGSCAGHRPASPLASCLMPCKRTDAPRQPTMLMSVLRLSVDPQTVFQRLYADAPVSFWLDSSSCCSGAAAAAAAAAEPATADAGAVPRARFSYMGSHGGPHSCVLRCRRLGRGHGAAAGSAGTCTAAAAAEAAMGSVSASTSGAVGSRIDASGAQQGAPFAAAELPARLRAELARWADAAPVAWPATTQSSATAAAPVVGGTAEARSVPPGVPPAETAAGAAAAAAATTTTTTTTKTTATAPAAEALPFAFRGGFVGFFGYEAWRWMGPTSGSSDLRGVAREEAATAGSAHGGGARGAGEEPTGAVKAQEEEEEEEEEDTEEGLATEDDEGADEAAFVFADRVVVFDHALGAVHLLCLCDEAEGDSRTAAAAWMKATTDVVRQLAASESAAMATAAASNAATAASLPPSTPSVPAPATAAAVAAATSAAPFAGFVPARDEASYIEDIDRVFDALRSGDSYEVCLTTQMARRASADAPPPPPLSLYSALRRINPAPYAAFLRVDPHRHRRDGRDGRSGRRGLALPGAATDTAAATAAAAAAAAAAASDDEDDGALGPGGFAVCCSSPERFLRIGASGAVESKPIKGTAPRGATPAEDERLREELRTSAKDRAENLMIVDLIRNDLSRVATAGSVHVPEGALMAIESYASVHQLVSTVRAQLDLSRHDALDAVATAFPPGSMTGAPKARTMRIIHELERAQPRGVYSGALGFLSVDGAADFNVVIRTAVVTRAGVRLGAGGAVVILSDAPSEWQEVLLKARPVMRAVAGAAAPSPRPDTRVPF